MGRCKLPHDIPIKNSILLWTFIQYVHKSFFGSHHCQSEKIKQNAQNSTAEKLALPLPIFMHKEQMKQEAFEKHKNTHLPVQQHVCHVIPSALPLWIYKTAGLPRGQREFALLKHEQLHQSDRRSLILTSRMAVLGLCLNLLGKEAPQWSEGMMRNSPLQANNGGVVVAREPRGPTC